MKFPALDVRGVDGDLALAVADDFAPTAVEELPDGIAIYFPTTARRDDALVEIARVLPGAVLAAREVDDEDWARRSQQNLTPVTVGRITVTPPWFAGASRPNGQSTSADSLSITIAPSMGFGTGHHATTRLCLAALQRTDVAGRFVLDVGTGSGVLAIAAAMLGAAHAIGIDVDADAVASARENLALNPAAAAARVEVADLCDTALPRADLVTANLTGAVLEQYAAVLAAAVRDGGALIVSGLQAHERDRVAAAFAGLRMVWSGDEDGWVALVFVRPATG